MRLIWLELLFEEATSRQLDTNEGVLSVRNLT
jgi:hypothetical protein